MMRRGLARSTTIFLLTAQLFGPLLQVERVLAADPSPAPTGAVGAAIFQAKKPDLTTVPGIMTDLKRKTRAISDYSSLGERIHLDPADKKYLNDWLAKGSNSDLTIDQPMLDILGNLATDPLTRTHDLISISEIIDPSNDVTDDESEPLPQYGKIDTNNRHNKRYGEAADITGLDQIRCTTVTYKNGKKDKYKIIDKQKLDPVPIEFKDQAKQTNTNGLSDPNGQVGPNSTNNLFGGNLDDLLRKANLPADTKAFQNLFAEGGIRVPTDALNKVTASNNGAALLDLAGQYLFQTATAGTRGQFVELGSSLPQTTDQIGSSLIASQFPGLTADMVHGTTLDQTARDAARFTLGQRLFGPGFQLTGQTGDEVFQNVAYQYFVAKVLRLQPSLELSNLPLGPNQVTASIGRLAAHERWGVSANSIKSSDTTVVLSALGDRLQRTNELDGSLNLPSGTIERVQHGELSVDQYFELAGHKLLETTVDLYPNDPSVRNLVYGTHIIFAGPDDVFVPTGDKQLDLIEEFYRQGPIQFINDADWTTFKQFYAKLNIAKSSATKTVENGLSKATTNSNTTATQQLNGNDIATTDLAGLKPDEKTQRIQTELWNRLNDPSDPVGDALGGHLTASGWTDFGKRVFSRALSSQPFEQLGLLAYLSSPDQTIWHVPFVIDQTATDQTAIPADLALLDHQVPLLEPDALAENHLGLLRGDLNLILHGGLETVILPRLGNDVFTLATGNAPAGGGYAAGLTMNPVWNDSFVSNTLATLHDKVPNLPETADLRKRLNTITPTDWQPTIDTTASQKMTQLITGLSQQFQPAAAKVTPGQYDTVTRLLGSLSAGRTLTPLTDLTPPSIVSDRGSGLTPAAMASWLAGDTTTDNLRRSLGTNFLSRYVFAASDPKQFTKDLTRLLQNPTADLQANFAASHASDLTNSAARVAQTFGINAQQFSGRDLLAVVGGNRTPMFGAASGSLFASLTGATGSIFGKDQSTFQQLVGLRTLLDTNHFGGAISLQGNLSQTILQNVFSQTTGIRWADNPNDLVRQNPKLFTLLGASPEAARAYAQAWDPNHPERAVTLLTNPAIWKDLPGTQELGKVLGTGAGPAIVSLLPTIFSGNVKPAALLGIVGQNIPQLLGNVGNNLNLQGVFASLQSGNNDQLRSSLLQLGAQSLAGKGQAGTAIAAIFGSGPIGSPAFIQQGIANLPKVFGMKDVPAFAPLVGQLASTLASGGHFDKTAMIGLAGQLAQTLKVPYAADIAKLATDPKGFGLTMATTMIAKQLDQTLGGSHYGEIRQALYGLSTGNYAAAGSAAIQTLLKDSKAGDLLKDLTPAARQSLINNLVTFNTAGLASTAAQLIGDKVMDKVVPGLPPGFTQAMLSGTGEQKITAIVGAATKLTNLSPELQGALSLITSKGDISKLPPSVFSKLDGVLSNVTGTALPPGIARGAADIISGHASFESMAKSLGGSVIADQLSKQMSGALDLKMGLPGGTGSFGFDSVGKFFDLSNKVNSPLLQKFEPAEWAKANADLNALTTQAGEFGVGLAINMVFGKQIAGFEKSIGLPPGTLNLFINAGIQSAFAGFSGAVFMSVLSSAVPIFLAFYVLGQLGILDGLFGGDDDSTATETICTPAGYYPYFTKDEETKAAGGHLADNAILDPNDNLDHYKPIKDRLAPTEVKKRLGLWPGYPGEFLGEASSSQEFQLGKQASARWAIHELIYELVTASFRLGVDTPGGINLLYQPGQMIAYRNGPGDLETAKPTDKQWAPQDGDYALPFEPQDPRWDANVYDDPRFISTTSDGKKIGLPDWRPEQGGFGDGTIGSNLRLKKAYPLEFIHGLQLENAMTYHDAVHFNM